MASRAANIAKGRTASVRDAGSRAPAKRASGLRGADWRAVLRRSLRRSLELLGGGIMAAALLFLALALVSYTQTDPSGSTASGSPVENWMGLAGAWASDKVLMLFGLPGVLLLPLMWVFARRMWEAESDLIDIDEDGEGGEAAPEPRWWRPTLVLLLAMALIGTTLALWASSATSRLPAGPGGLSGLLGAAAINALAGLVPQIAPQWISVPLGLVALVGGLALAARVFAFDWAQMLTLPPFLRRASHDIDADEDGEDEAPAPAPRKDRRDKEARATADSIDLEDALAQRKPTEISDPTRTPTLAAAPPKARQGDLFDNKYELPSIELLVEAPAGSAQKIDKLALERNARLLENVLDDFNVKGEITAVRTGPVVTMYELEPAPGIKASRVIGLADDIARNMSAISARVSAIPGRTVMGIELPNAIRDMVGFRELVACEKFVNSKALLPIILGKDIAGEPIVADLATMPHLLVAGTTGSGKSVGLNCILLSLLYRLTPAQCRMILVDPKVLELKSYDDIPHLLSPVVTEPSKAVRALKWAVEEMERRYRQMSSIGVRNISGFNEKVRAAQAKGKPLGRRIQVGFDPDTGEELFEEQQLDYEVLPQIVVIVDELADLMVTVGKEIEVLIQRLSQKSRAAGIHLIMATQRPSVDVITGVIKANLPTRISFAVTSRIDSRTILGEQGAEQLLGKGDMLYKPNTDPIKRVHGPFVSDEEVEKVADHWRGQGSPDYVDSVTEEPEDGGFGFDDIDSASDNPEDRKYRQVCQLVFESQKASASWIQRQMGVGYNTASKWIERMEADGLVGPANHVGRREIYRDKDGNVL
ncbi:FtsK/SpoIIIE family DNA translocase [Novosphingobium taihuense]|uniref:DNA translocase FtsK n=1 Tax=Novosphingobium taihuense TaxID=260085 RepID=A0A7W7AF27_9SPHN|nr:DNA translocase FtsK 4TM domain-containing protein [Novosphingobium taihuense]MBB4615868.1 S-DNA-T family DNA segregation ATPase FtsK/SpoIIIE [Novosphingobium taihuense]TWH79126.1 S-DNA-T family DNA segregation ATPase FtsK/SpoIIIE [Novosphingobium taihuense]